MPRSPQSTSADRTAPAGTDGTSSLTVVISLRMPVNIDPDWPGIVVSDASRPGSDNASLSKGRKSRSSSEGENGLSVVDVPSGPYAWPGPRFNSYGVLTAALGQEDVPGPFGGCTPYSGCPRRSTPTVIMPCGSGGLPNESVAPAGALKDAL